MKLSFRTSALLAATVSFATLSFALSSNSIGDIVKAQILIGKVMDVMQKYRETTITLEAPTPIADNSGKYLLPYKADGEPTEWAGKALNAQVGKLVGEKAGDMATNALASKIPFGGLAGGLLKKKVKESAGMIALGGADFLKKNSDQSFANLNDYAVFLQVRHGADSNYKEVLAAAIAVYPDLEGRFEGAIKDAYRKQAEANARKAG